jgi:hypothetical protein
VVRDCVVSQILFSWDYMLLYKFLEVVVPCTRAVCRVRGITFLLRVGTLWRCGDGLFRSAFLGKLCTFLQRATHFSKTCCRPLVASKFLALELPFHGWKSPEIAWAGRDLDYMADVLMGFHRSTFFKPNTEFYSGLAPCDFWAFRTMKRELGGKKFKSDQRSAAHFRKVDGAL